METRERFDERLWHYRARYERVIDGDTLELTVELPFDLRAEMKVRLAGYNAPERNTPEGREAAYRLMTFFRSDAYTSVMLESRFWPLRVVTHKTPQTGDEVRSFERYVADVSVIQPDGSLRDLVDIIREHREP